MSRKIITCFECPPLARRELDWSAALWSAALDNYGGAHSPLGTGATEREAVSNLLDQLDDAAWAEVWQGWIERT